MKLKTVQPIQSMKALYVMNTESHLTTAYFKILKLETGDFNPKYKQQFRFIVTELGSMRKCYCLPLSSDLPNNLLLRLGLNNTMDTLCIYNGIKSSF